MEENGRRGGDFSGLKKLNKAATLTYNSKLLRSNLKNKYASLNF